MKQALFKPPGIILGADMINGRVSDHSRSPIQVSFTRIESSNRMANGKLRKYVVATKQKWSLSWDLLPHSRAHTVDGFMGANELKAFYDENIGSFQLITTTGELASGTDFAYQHPATASSFQQVSFKAFKSNVTITDFSRELVKRGHLYDMYNVSLSMEEI